MSEASVPPEDPPPSHPLAAHDPAPAPSNGTREVYQLGPCSAEGPPGWSTQGPSVFACNYSLSAPSGQFSAADPLVKGQLFYRVGQLSPARRSKSNDALLRDHFGAGTALTAVHSAGDAACIETQPEMSSLYKVELRKVFCVRPVGERIVEIEGEVSTKAHTIVGGTDGFLHMIRSLTGYDTPTL